MISCAQFTNLNSILVDRVLRDDEDDDLKALGVLSSVTKVISR